MTTCHLVHTTGFADMHVFTVQVLIPQHNYKLDAESLNTRHYGEV